MHFVSAKRGVVAMAPHHRQQRAGVTSTTTGMSETMRGGTGGGRGAEKGGEGGAGAGQGAERGAGRGGIA